MMNKSQIQCIETLKSLTSSNIHLYGSPSSGKKYMLKHIYNTDNVNRHYDTDLKIHVNLSKYNYEPCEQSIYIIDKCMGL